MNEQFKSIIESGDFVILDTETTGLNNTAEACQISVIDSRGGILINTLVRPVYPIPADATRIHGITNAHVSEAPTFAQIAEQLKTVLTGQNLIIYNADYDMRILNQSDASGFDWYSPPNSVWCAMNAFSPIYGEWNDWHGNYRWQRLSTAAAYYSVPVVDAHNALGDCLMTLGVVRGMAGVK